MPKLEKRKRISKDIIRKNRVVVKNPTSKSCWKSFERVVAKMFGTTRVPLSGSNSGHGTNSDSLHKTLYIECKVRGKSATYSLFLDTLEKAKAEGKIPIVAVKQKNTKGFLLVIRPEDLVQISKELSDEQGGATKRNAKGKKADN